MYLLPGEIVTVRKSLGKSFMSGELFFISCRFFEKQSKCGSTAGCTGRLWEPKIFIETSYAKI